MTVQQVRLAFLTLALFLLPSGVALASAAGQQTQLREHGEDFNEYLTKDILWLLGCGIFAAAGFYLALRADGDEGIKRAAFGGGGLAVAVAGPTAMGAIFGTEGASIEPPRTDWLPKTELATTAHWEPRPLSLPVSVRAPSGGSRRSRRRPRPPGTWQNKHAEYQLEGDHPQWTPVRVYTDGTCTTIEFPPALANQDDLPALLIIQLVGGEDQLVEYRQVGTRYIVDAVVGRAELIAGVGADEKRVRIVRTLPPRHARPAEAASPNPPCVLPEPLDVQA